MAHVDTGSSLPGVQGLFEFRDQTASPLRDLAQTLLRGASPLSCAERELIAAYVSRRNGCEFCFKSHAAAAGALLGVGLEVLEDMASGAKPSQSSGKLRALLDIAAKVCDGGRAVAAQDIAAARAAGADDIEIHDTVLIAAAFCMFNRYVDGLATWAPAHNEAYSEMGQRLAERGYIGGSEQPSTAGQGGSAL